MRTRLVCCLVITLVVGVGCQAPEPEASEEVTQVAPAAMPMERLSIYTVNYPLQYFAERLGGERVEVFFPAPEGEDPAYWSPGPEVIAAYQGADLILLNGVDYAKWLQRATLPAGRLVDTSAGFEDRWLALEEGPVHSHGPEGEHSHKGYAFTTWLDPQLAMEQAAAVAAALRAALPGSVSEIEAAEIALRADLEALDQRLAAAAEKLGDRPLLFSHPVYQYLERRYQLNARSLHWEPGEAPSASQWEELEGLLVEHPAEWMIWESIPSEATAQRLADLGVESLVYAPGANRPAAGDLLTVMADNAAALESISATE